jgi:hypothetical protein
VYFRLSLAASATLAASSFCGATIAALAVRAKVAAKCSTPPLPGEKLSFLSPSLKATTGLLSLLLPLSPELCPRSLYRTRPAGLIHSSSATAVFVRGPGDPIHRCVEWHTRVNATAVLLLGAASRRWPR